jgi:hypothetical protein
MLPDHAKRTAAGSLVSKRPTSRTIEGAGAGAEPPPLDLMTGALTTGVGGGVTLGESCLVQPPSKSKSSENASVQRRTRISAQVDTSQS